MKKNKGIIIAISMVVLGIFFIKYGLDYEKNVAPVYNYTIQKDDDYNVLLKPNEFYGTEVLPKGGYYASNSIKTTNLDLKYNFKANKKTNIEYNYKVEAYLVGSVKNYDNEDKEIWNRCFELSDNKSNKLEAINQFYIEEKVNIDYGYYKDLVCSYEKCYKVTIDAILKIRLNIYYEIKLDSLGAENDKVEDCIELDIPITDTVTEVKENYEAETSKEIKPKVENNVVYKNSFCIIGVVLIIAAGAVIVAVIKKNKKTAEEKYEYNLKQILKYYKDLIVTVTNEPQLKELKVMKVSNLDDLIDVAEQTNNNIIHYKEPNKKKSYFYVIVDCYVYVYKLKSDV